MSFERELAVFRLVLANVPVVAQPPRTDVHEMQQLEKLDPAAAERIRAQLAQIR